MTDQRVLLSKELHWSIAIKRNAREYIYQKEVLGSTTINRGAKEPTKLLPGSIKIQYAKQIQNKYFCPGGSVHVVNGNFRPLKILALEQTQSLELVPKLRILMLHCFFLSLYYCGIRVSSL